MFSTAGFLIGPLLKKYSYRQVAFLGAFLSSSGLILTSKANSMLYIICTYSILGGMYGNINHTQHGWFCMTMMSNDINNMK